jgi:threonylcarbamoyladenosine tRNA methylthiotransferase MtaB
MSVCLDDVREKTNRKMCYMFSRTSGYNILRLGSGLSGTEEDFEATMDFARRARFLMIHVFPYSKRQGTPAAVMPDQVPGEIKKQRVAALSALSADIRREILTELIEKKTILPVLFETYTEGTAVGHTPNFIEVHVPVPTSLHAQTHNVRLVALTEDGTGCIGQLC